MNKKIIELKSQIESLKQSCNEPILLRLAIANHFISLRNELDKEYKQNLTINQNDLQKIDNLNRIWQNSIKKIESFECQINSYKLSENILTAACERLKKIEAMILDSSSDEKNLNAIDQFIKNEKNQLNKQLFQNKTIFFLDAQQCVDLRLKNYLWQSEAQSYETSWFEDDENDENNEITIGKLVLINDEFLGDIIEALKSGQLPNELPEDLVKINEMRKKLQSKSHILEECLDLNSLQTIDYSFEQILVINSKTFQNLNNLTELILLGNRISEIKADCFADLSCLHVLHLGCNQISVIDEDAFRGLVNLKELYLYWNQISVLDAYVFKDLNNLTILNLSRNKIVKINEMTFRGLTNLKELHMHWNKLSFLNENMFEELISLEYLDLHWNKLDETNLFKGLSSLVDLDLGGNEIKCLNANMFQGFNSLKRLTISDNRIETIEDCTFKALTNLVELNLAADQINMINQNTFYGLINLEKLYLEKNEIVELKQNVFSHLIKLRLLDLTHNKISVVNQKSFQGLDSLRKLFIDKNILLENMINLNEVEIVYDSWREWHNTYHDYFGMFSERDENDQDGNEADDDDIDYDDEEDEDDDSDDEAAY